MAVDKMAKLSNPATIPGKTCDEKDSVLLENSGASPVVPCRSTSRGDGEKTVCLAIWVTAISSPRVQPKGRQRLNGRCQYHRFYVNSDMIPALATPALIDNRRVLML